MTIIVGGVVRSNGKYLLVQEKKDICYGKWNISAGHLEENESIFAGAKREIKEETGLNVELNGIIHIGDKIVENEHIISFIFETSVTDGNISFNEDELLDVKWFTYEEVLAMKNQLRNPELVIDAIKKVEENKVVSSSIISNSL